MTSTEKHQSYLVEYELSSQAILKSVTELKFVHPLSSAQITLREVSTDPNLDFAVLSAFVVIEATSLESALETSRTPLSEFVDTLTLATSCDIRIGKRKAVVEWGSGLTERQMIHLTEFPGDGRPFEILDNTLIEEVVKILALNLPSPLSRAIHWFSVGVSAHFQDEKFRCFWFVIEILAQFLKPPEKVNDRCPICNSSLFCSECDLHPKHRPYAKQAIEMLFKKINSKKGGKSFLIANDVRNRLLHGQSALDVEKELQIPFCTHVDVAGNYAWNAIFGAIGEIASENDIEYKARLVVTNTYCETIGVAHTHLSYTPATPGNPRIGEWPSPDIIIDRKKIPDTDSADDI